jgi:hypothetical protein
MMFLKVPFAEKDEAKSLGARWNSERKSWYVPDGKDSAAFARWLPPGGADFVPAIAAATPRSHGVTVDSYVGKSVTGKLFVDMQHLCNPFEVCPQCAPRLLECGWQAAHQAVGQTLAALA